jgi:Flp pilus assembly protein TadB
MGFSARSGSSTYFRALFETTRLDRAEATAAFTLAADLINSSLELGRTLDAALAAGLEDNEGFFPAVNAISSSAEKGRVLMDVLKKATLTPARQVDFLASAATIESNAGCAAVLDAFATRYQVAEGPVRNAFLAALKTVDSNFERGRLREKLVSATPQLVN